MTFNGNVFIGLKKQIITEATDSEIDISVDVTTTEENGLILWKRSTSSEDHIGLGIVDGFVMFEYNYGKENRRVQIKSKTKINDGNKHHVNAIKKNGGSGTLFVDFDEELVDPEPPIIEDKLDLSSGLLYLGGLPQNMDVATTTKGSFSSAFTGCLTSLSVEFSVGGLHRLGGQRQRRFLQQDFLRLPGRGRPWCDLRGEVPIHQADTSSKRGANRC